MIKLLLRYINIYIILIIIHFVFLFCFSFFFKHTAFLINKFKSNIYRVKNVWRILFNKTKMDYDANKISRNIK